ncbi:MAG: hypothetical protein IKC32_00045 [Clostridia bacterium]|nr:hypothetical protein [Clostridia bacterium]
MAEKFSDRDVFTKPIESMTEAERLRAIERLELLRDEVTYQIEDVMSEVAAETGKRKYKSKRKDI